MENVTVRKIVTVTNPESKFVSMVTERGLLVEGSEVFNSDVLTQIEVDVTGLLERQGTAERIIANWILWEGYGDRYSGVRFTVKG